MEVVLYSILKNVIIKFKFRMTDRLQGKKFDEVPDDPTTKELNTFV